MIQFLGLIFSIIIFCVFIGMFIRLGRIERVLIKMATHQGAIQKNEASKHDVLHDVYGDK